MMGPFLFCVVVDGYCVVVLVLLVGGSCVIGWWFLCYWLVGPGPRAFCGAGGCPRCYIIWVYYSTSVTTGTVPLVTFSRENVTMGTVPVVTLVV